jgi:hypothetical protein
MTAATCPHSSDAATCCYRHCFATSRPPPDHRPRPGHRARPRQSRDHKPVAHRHNELPPFVFTLDRYRGITMVSRRQYSANAWAPEKRSVEGGSIPPLMCAIRASRTHSFRHIYQPPMSESDARRPILPIQIDLIPKEHSQTTAEPAKYAATIRRLSVRVRRARAQPSVYRGLEDPARSSRARARSLTVNGSSSHGLLMFLVLGAGWSEQTTRETRELLDVRRRANHFRA